MTGDREPRQFTPEEREKWDRHFPPPPEVIFEGYRRYRETWQRVANETGARFIPMEAIGITGPENYCQGDPIHFSVAGSDAMGRRMAERLLASGVL